MNAEIKVLHDCLLNSIMEDKELIEEFEIQESFLKTSLEDFLTKKYIINGELSIDDITDEELQKVLTEASMNSVLDSLKKKMLIDEFEGDFFLTEQGKQLSQIIK